MRRLLLLSANKNTTTVEVQYVRIVPTLAVFFLWQWHRCGLFLFCDVSTLRSEAGERDGLKERFTNTRLYYLCTIHLELGSLPYAHFLRDHISSPFLPPPPTTPRLLLLLQTEPRRGRRKQQQQQQQQKGALLALVLPTTTTTTTTVCTTSLCVSACALWQHQLHGIFLPSLLSVGELFPPPNPSLPTVPRTQLTPPPPAPPLKGETREWGGGKNRLWRVDSRTSHSSTTALPATSPLSRIWSNGYDET